MIQEDIDLNKLELHMDKLFKKDIYKNNNPGCCPICGCGKYIKYGLYSGIQRYKCKECGKTFSNTTNSVWSYSKKSPKLWMEFLELLLEKRSLRFCAEKLGINLVTAFYWRHKVLHGLTLDSTPNSLKGVIYIGKIIIKENFKGCRNIRAEIKINRRRNIWIIGSKGQDDSMFVKPVFRDFWDWKTFYEKIYPKVEKDAYIVPYGDRYISIAAQKHNKNSFIDAPDDDRIKYFILNYENWFAVFRGVASKYLQKYCSLFILFNLDRTINYMDMMYHELFSGNRFIATNKIRDIEDYMY